jgi:hypothetical protein
MKITIDRSGGFANIPLHREIDTAALPYAEAAEIERLAEAARKVPVSSAPMPDAYSYVITIDGVQDEMTESSGAWEKLIELVLHSE